jgi:hypothetical protein
MRRLVARPVAVRIAAGSFFVPANRRSQSMVGAKTTIVPLPTTAWTTSSLAAASANRLLAIPGTQDRFALKRGPDSEALARVAAALDDASVTSAVRQAAVWIVTDDATFAGLATLVSPRTATTRGGTRLIRQAEVARALQILEAAGIDFRTKAIWKDRELILSGLGDTELATWLRGRSS